ncbi:hypothetical protein HDU93_001369, partial [Gonapodya sp. JEL0774]
MVASSTLLGTLVLAACLILPLGVHGNALPSIEKFGRDLPVCRAIREDFNDPNTMVPIDSASISSIWVNEQWPLDHARIENGNLVLKLELMNNYVNSAGKNEGTGATVSFNPMWNTGKVCFSLKASPGKGVVSAFMVSSFTPNQPIDDNLLVEWVGHAQSNYYAFGNDKPRAENFALTDYATNYHTYCVERCNTFVAWSVDGKEVRRITNTSVGGMANFPYRKGKIVFNIWDGNAPGYTTWASGPT